jgi:hypothetical protein
MCWSTHSLVTRTKLIAKQCFCITAMLVYNAENWNKSCISFEDLLPCKISGPLRGASVIPNWQVCMFTLLQTGKTKIAMPRPAVPALMKISQLVQYLTVGDSESMTSSAYFFVSPLAKESSSIYNSEGTA